MYLAARSVIEENIYFISQKYLNIPIVEYQNYHELIFTIYPKLNYDAFKNYNRKQNQDLDQEEMSILQKRLENE